MALTADRVSAALVTRGDVDLEPVIESIRDAGISDIQVWNNAERGWDLKVFGRFVAAQNGEHDFIYTQDDDAICPVAAILEAWDGDDLLVNVPADEDWPWLAWGALFRRPASEHAFGRYVMSYGFSMSDIYRWPDVIFAELTSHRRVDLGHRNLEQAFAENRMYRQPDHYETQEEVRDRCRRLV